MRRISWGRIFILAALVCIVAALYLMSIATQEHDDRAVYARIGSEPVYLDDLERSYAQRSPAQENLSLEAFFEETYAPRTMLLLEARERNITVPQAEIDAWIAVINATLQSRNITFQTYLDDLNATYDQLRQDIYETTLLDKTLEALVAREIMVSAEEVQQAYDAAGYEALGIPLEEARNEIGPAILREKQDARLRALVEELRERYDVTIV
jgi:hypothetical protein